MYHIIINPASRSGKGIEIWKECKTFLMERQVEYFSYFTKGIGDASSYAVSITKKIESEFIHIIVLGGDGTMNEVVQGIQNFSKVRISYIPTGSSNDLARDLKIPQNPIVALSQVLDRPSHIQKDVGVIKYKEVNTTDGENTENEITRRFCVGTGIGFDAAVCEEALRSKIKRVCNKIGLGKLSYLGIALKQIIATPSISCKLTLDHKNEVHINKFMFIASMIHKYEGGGFKFCPFANMSDGLLDLCVIGDIPKWFVVLVIPTAFFGKHMGFRGISSYRAKHVVIQTKKPLWIHTDGEIPGKTQDITITILDQKMNMYY